MGIRPALLVRHLCAAAWLAEHDTPANRLLQKAMDDWREPVEMKTAILGWSGGRIIPQGYWRKPDALRCWAAERGPQGPDTGEPFVKVASVLGQVDGAIGELMIRVMLDSGARPDVADRNGVLPLEAARKSGASARLLALFEEPPSKTLYDAFTPAGKE